MTCLCCASCQATLTTSQYRYCSVCRSVLWDRAPLPEGHPAGTVGADLRDARRQQLPLPSCDVAPSPK